MNAIDQVVLYILLYSMLAIIFLLTVTGDYSPEPAVQAETIAVKTKPYDRYCYPDNSSYPSCWRI